MGSLSTEIRRNGFPVSPAYENTWRSCQKRVVEHVDSDLHDERAHIVAAPGLDKTALGLETASLDVS